MRREGKGRSGLRTQPGNRRKNKGRGGRNDVLCLHRLLKKRLAKIKARALANGNGV